MASTKKLLVAFDSTRPDRRSSGFLIPRTSEGRMTLHELKSGKEHALGLMIFIGRTVTENDLFAKLIDSGAVIGNVEETLSLLRSYLEQLQSLKIGNVVRLAPAVEGDVDSCRLVLVAKTPSSGGMLCDGE